MTAQFGVYTKWKIANLIAFVLLLSSWNQANSQTTYTTVAGGAWDIASTWDIGVPPSPLPSTDSIIINHDVTFDVTKTVRGVIRINTNASLTDVGGANLKIGKGAVNSGELINYGSITVRNLEVKPKNGGVATDAFPVLHNYGTITASNDLKIGNNNGAGTFNNYSTGVVNVADEIVLKSFLINSGSMYVSNVVKNYGGTIDGCGFIETPTIDIESNTGRPGTFECIQICGPSGSPTLIIVAGVFYFDFDDAYNNAPASEVVFNSVTTVFCSPAVLPVELIAFDASVVNNQMVALSWETATEMNNDFFTIERSRDGENWQVLGAINGAGNSTQTLSYSFTDENPYSGTSYYRLKQTDFDGQHKYSDVKIVTFGENETKEVVLYPNPTKGNFSIVLGTANQNLEIQVLDQVGKIVYTLNQENAASTISVVPNIPVGMYFVKILTENNDQIIKLIVE